MVQLSAAVRGDVVECMVHDTVLKTLGLE